ncbi:MAG: valine--tRNA ligase [Candidatus Dormiibacterota bacterium]
MEKHFDWSSVEPKWRERWSDLGVGHADVTSTKPAYVIALPPPNITGALHMGHASTFSIQDTVCRERRMRGYEVEWAPGTDHAAIATENVIERQLAEEGLTKEALGRAAFQSRVDAWYEEYGGRILEQMRRMGYTCDWERLRFTLDDQYVHAIRLVFKTLFDEGLVYRGPRIVNWCPYCRSAISDEEIDWQEQTDTLYYLKYPVEGGQSITVATVRPETMLGDTGVAVALGDSRYASLIGKHVTLPLTWRVVPIIADQAVRPEFGTGALKVTPGHDPTDYEIGARHSLPIVNVIALDGTMDVPSLPQFHGMPVDAARTAVAEALRALGVLVKEEPYTHDVGHCDRSGTVLEPLVSEQWWVRMASLAAPGIGAVESGEITFHPARYTDVYLHWMRNIKDWCISRQIWLGHAIPVSTCGNGHRFAWIDPPTRCPDCGDTSLTNDPDVLDTWFSSGLWPFAIFGWPEQTPDLEKFYPTDLLVTGRDIIFLWVARMIMNGIKFTGRNPFTDVLITSTIQATDGSRMSKSKGNTVDPLDLADKYGADAVRAWAAAVSTSVQDMRFDEDRIASYQRFANKLWQVTSGFLVAKVGNGSIADLDVHPPKPETLRPEDRWMLAELAAAVRACDSGFAAYRFHEAVDALYDTIWHSFCDWYVEIIKFRLADAGDHESRRAAVWTAVTTLDVLLRLLHPFMPFVTEECAQQLPNAEPTLQHRSWPEQDPLWSEAATASAHHEIAEAIELVKRIRALGHGRKVPRGARDRIRITVRDGEGRGINKHVSRLIGGLVPGTVVDSHEPGVDPAVVVSGRLHAEVVIADTAADASATARQIGLLEANVSRLQAQLANPAFVNGAPAQVVDEARRRLAEATAQLDLLRRGRLGGSADAAG